MITNIYSVDRRFVADGGDICRHYLMTGVSKMVELMSMTLGNGRGTGEFNKRAVSKIGSLVLV